MAEQAVTIAEQKSSDINNKISEEKVKQHSKLEKKNVISFTMHSVKNMSILPNDDIKGHYSNDNTSKNTSSVIQKKLKINAVNDKFEREADQIAKTIIRQPFTQSVESNEPDKNNSSNPQSISKTPETKPQQKINGSSFENTYDRIDRKDLNGSLSNIQNPMSVSRLKNSKGGHKLPENISDFMGSRFGLDFSNVRIHNDSNSALLNNQLNSRAFTYGSNIYFNRGEYTPNSSTGIKLLAHELTHTIQQQSNSEKVLQRENDPVSKESNLTPVLAHNLSEKDTLLLLQGIHIQHKGNYSKCPYWIASGNILKLYDAKLNVVESSKIKVSADVQTYVYYFNPTNDSLYPWTYETLADGRKQLVIAGLKINKVFKKNEKAIQELFGSISPQKAPNIKKYMNGVFSLAFRTADNEGIGDGEVKPKKPRWAKKLQSAVLKLISEKKKLEFDAIDLPDTFSIYYSSRFKDWRMVVRQKDAVGKSTLSRYIAIPNRKETEKNPEAQVSNVLKVVRAEIRRQQIRQEEEVAIKEEKKLPAEMKWVFELKKEVEKLIYEKRKGHPDSFHFRDKISVILSDEDNLHFQVWAWIVKQDREGKNASSYKKAVLPVPLTKESKADDIFYGVQLLIGSLRTPKGPASEGEKDENKQFQVYQSYTSVIKPLNMRPDNVSVTGGEHEFRILIDYSKYNVSLLGQVATAMRSSYSTWEIYKIDPEKNLTEEERKKIPTEWDARQEWLKPKFQTFSDLKGVDSVFSESTYSWEEDLKMPIVPGDYIVYCRTQIEPRETDDGKIIQNIPSEAFYPVHLKKGYELAEDLSLATLREQQALEKKIKKTNDEKKKAELSQQLDVMKAAERSSLYSNLSTKKTDINETITQLNDLRTLEKQRANNPLSTAITESSHSEKQKQKLIQLWTYLTLSFTSGTLLDKIAKLKKQLLKDRKKINIIHDRASEYQNEFKDPDATLTPIIAIASQITGRSYLLITMIGETKVSEEGKYEYQLVDLTIPTKSKKYSGKSADKETAVKKAIEALARNGNYGEGYMSYRIPGIIEGGERMHVHPGLKKNVINVLKAVAAVAGIAALIIGTAASGGALGAAALGLGLAAGGIGLGLAISSIKERSENYRLKPDAELFLDIIDIVGAVVLGAGAVIKGLGSAARAASAASKVVNTTKGLVSLQRINNALRIYDIAELGGASILMAIKVQEDIQAIEESDMPQVQKDALKHEVILNAIISGAMLLPGAASSYKDFKGFSRSKLNSYEYLNRKSGITTKSGDWSPTIHGKTKGKKQLKSRIEPDPDLQGSSGPKKAKQKPDAPPSGSMRRVTGTPGDSPDNPVRHGDENFRELKAGKGKYYTDKGGSLGYAERLNADQTLIRLELGQTTKRANYQQKLHPTLEGLPTNKGGFQLLHAAGPIVGHESPHGILIGPWTLNNLYQNWFFKGSGIEVFLGKDFTRNRHPDYDYHLEIITTRHLGEVYPGKEFLKSINYKVVVTKKGTSKKDTAFEITLTVDQPENPNSSILHDLGTSSTGRIEEFLKPLPRKTGLKSPETKPHITPVPMRNIGSQAASSGSATPKKSGTLFAQPTVKYDPNLPAGHGSTDPYGNIIVSTKGSHTDQQLVLYHEKVHSALSPKFKYLRNIRAKARMTAYKKSHFMRYLEEALAETYARLKVNGIKDLPAGLSFPVKNGYVTLSNVIAEGAIGVLAYGAVLYGVYIATQEVIQESEE